MYLHAVKSGVHREARGAPEVLDDSCDLGRRQGSWGVGGDGLRTAIDVNNMNIGAARATCADSAKRNALRGGICEQTSGAAEKSEAGSFAKNVVNRERARIFYGLLRDYVLAGGIRRNGIFGGG